MTVEILRALFRELETWRAAYQRDITLQTLRHDGVEWHLLDVERLYEISQTEGVLAPRQAQAIRLFLVGNMRESDVAVAMGIKPTNPVGEYATDGLHKLVRMVEMRYITLIG